MLEMDVQTCEKRLSHRRHGDITGSDGNLTFNDTSIMEADCVRSKNHEDVVRQNVIIYPSSRTHSPEI